MADVRDRVGAEMENIKRTLKAIPPKSRCAKLTPLELAVRAYRDPYDAMRDTLKRRMYTCTD